MLEDGGEPAMVLREANAWHALRRPLCDGGPFVRMPSGCPERACASTSQSQYGAARSARSAGGVTLGQLRALAAHVNRRCRKEGWTSFRKVGIALRAPRRAGRHSSPLLTAHAGEAVACGRLDVRRVRARDNTSDPRAKMLVCRVRRSIASGVLLVGQAAFAKRSRPLATPASFHSPRSQRLQFVVTHWWGQPFLQLVAALEQHASDHRLDPTGTVYWLAALAINPHRLTNDDEG